MSLYYEAAGLIENPDKKGGSLKSRVFGSKTLKSNKAAIFALVTESTKWSPVLKDVVEKSGILKLEKKVGIHHHPQRRSHRSFGRISSSLTSSLNRPGHQASTDL